MTTRQTPQYSQSTNNNNEYDSYTSTQSHILESEPNPLQNNDTQHKSVSRSSSINNELAAINAAAAAAGEHNQPIINDSKATFAKARRQHTLSSLNNERSRTRCPIVVCSSDSSTVAEIQPIGKSNVNDSNSQQLAIAAAAAAAACNLSPVERISIESFERRRSIYENEAMRAKRQALLCNKTNFSDEEGGGSDDLSLDRILAHIESNSGRQQQQEQPFVSLNDQTLATAAMSNHVVRSTSKSSFNLNSIKQLNLNQEQTYNSIDDSHELRSFKQIDAESGKITGSTSDLSTTSIPLESSPETSAVSVIDKKSNGLGDEDEASSRKRMRKNEVETGFEIVWLNFTYSVEPNILEDPRWGKVNSLFHKEHRMILKGLSGGLKSGQMVALMGPSGAGKTCLLECISGVRLSGIGGEMCLRGRKHAQLVIVPQYDDFMPQFTVEEIIAYGSKMKNPFSADHKSITNKVIEQLGLQVCRSNNIQKCSGGQRKRVAIAQELVSRPNILILDEPTSGLDSSCCYQTMKVLRDVLDQSVHTEQPMAIVTTIHQPSAKVFKMFDLIYLLGKTGYAAYFGPPDDLLPTIRDVTGLECPQYSNPSDYMIELVSYDYGEEPVEKLVEYEKEKAKQFVRDYELRAGVQVADRIDAGANVKRRPSKTDSASGASLHMKLKPSKSDTNLVIQDPAAAQQHKPLHQRLKSTLLTPTIEHSEYKNNVSIPLRKATGSGGRSHPFFWHTLVHFHRSFLQSIRDPILNNMRILIHLGFATLLVLLYGKKSGEARGCPPVLGLPREITDPNNESMIDLGDNVGYLFMCIMMITYVSLMSTVLTFPIDIKTVGKEYKNGWYGTVTYFLGKSLADLPFIIVYPVVYCLITWYLTNQAPDHVWRYFSFTGLIIMNAMNSQSFGLILGALFVNSVTAATFLGPVITIPWYLFTGFTKRVHRLAEPYKTTSKFLFTRYVFEGLLDTVYGHERCNCSEFLEKYYDLRSQEAVRLGQLISVETLSSLDYYDGLDTVAQEVRNRSLLETGSQWFEKTVDAASTVFADGEDLNLASLMETNVKASSMFSFGLDFEPTCPANYKNYVIQDFRLNDKTMETAFITTFCMLSLIRVLTFILVAWKIRTRQL